MASAEDLYERYIVKAEKNSTNDYFSTDRQKFALLYNELSKRVLKLYSRNRKVNIRKEIQNLLIDDKKVSDPQKHLDHFDFDIPKDFFDWSFVRAVGGNEKCSNEKIDLYEIRDEDRGSFMTNGFLKPSFSYREAPYLYSEDKVKVFVEDGMHIDKIYISYYRKPKEIKLQNPEDPESQFQQIDIEIKDEVLDRIISAMVGDFKINNEDEAFQLDKQRQNENIAPMSGANQ